MLRQTWQVDVHDLKWSLDSRIRFWIKGSRLARQPHGGILLIESGGRAGVSLALLPNVDYYRLTTRSGG